MNKILALGIIAIALILANYLYTFSGFVTYTSEERRGAVLLEYLLNTTPNTPERTTRTGTLTDTDKEVISKYVNQYKSSNSRYKTIQQFYLEEVFIILLFTLLILYFKKKDKNI